MKAAARTGPEMSLPQRLAKDTLVTSPSWSEGQRAGRDLRRSHLLHGSWRTGGCSSMFVARRGPWQIEIS